VVPFDDAETCRQSCEPCEAFTEDPVAMNIPVTIHNGLDVPLYLDVATPSEADPLYFFFAEYTIEDDAQVAALPVHDEPCDNDFACGNLENLCGGCDPGPPYQPGAIRIDPGVTYDAATWDGHYWVDTTMAAECGPAECVDANGSDFSCTRRVPHGGWGFTARARAGTTLDGTDCDTDTAGWCQTGAGSAPVEPLLEAQVYSEFPGSGVALEFVP
jgi:hypothetical protein